MSEARTAVNSASKVRMREALVPLVCWRPQASAAGPSTAPNKAIRHRRRACGRRGRASLVAGERKAKPAAAAPALSKATVIHGPTPVPARWRSGVLTPNRRAAAKANITPFSTGLPPLASTVLVAVSGDVTEWNSQFVDTGLSCVAHGPHPQACNVLAMSRQAFDVEREPRARN